MVKVFVGYDSREPEAFDVLEYSIKKYCPAVDVHSLVQAELRQAGIYTRPVDLTASTEFSLTRFLVPFLQNYEGWAVFMDSDMLVTANIEELFELADPQFAVQVVKHLHQPVENRKMNNQLQTCYEKKNWSSCVLWNCGHEKNKNLRPEVVSNVHPAFLHRFWFLDPSDIGELPLTWNYLVQYYHKWPEGVIPKNLHFTNGFPLIEGHEHDDYADLWFAEFEEMKANRNY